jgi:gluconokinase
MVLKKVFNTLTQSPTHFKFASMNDKAAKSFHDKTGGMMYFPRMLDKIRLFAQGELREDCHAALGGAGRGDGRCCRFLRVDYEALKKRVLAGGTDEEILEWCFTNGRRLDETDIFIWNEFMRKRGLNDEATARLATFKAESGHTDRADLMTIPDYHDVLEGRKP